MVTPLGLNAQETWSNLLAGKSGIAPISLFDASGFPSRIAGEVKKFDFERWKIKDPALRDAGRATFFALGDLSRASASTPPRGPNRRHFRGQDLSRTGALHHAQRPPGLVAARVVALALS